MPQRHTDLSDAALKGRGKKPQSIPSYRKLLQWVIRLILYKDDEFVRSFVLLKNKPTTAGWARCPRKKKQILNYYNDNILKPMHYTYTTYNLQAIIFQSLRYTYATYNIQMTLQSIHYIYTTYNLQAITFQSLRYTYTNYF